MRIDLNRKNCSSIDNPEYLISNDKLVLKNLKGDFVLNSPIKLKLKNEAFSKFRWEKLVSKCLNDSFLDSAGKNSCLIHLSLKPDKKTKLINTNLHFGMSIENPLKSPYVENHRLTSIAIGDGPNKLLSPLCAARMYQSPQY